MKTILTTLFILAAALPPVFSQTVETVIHGQPDNSRQLKTQIILPAAPFLGPQVNVLDVFPWLEEVTRLADPEGAGIKFEVRITDSRPPESRNTLAQWRDLQEDSATWPQIRRITVEEYLIYLCKVADLTYTTTTESVIIEKAK